MKKILTLLFAFMAMTFCVKAQTLLNESFDTGTLPAGWTMVDSDGDGFNWVLSAGTTINTHSGGGCIFSESYDNNYGPLYPDNWLITPAINLTADAILAFWISAQDPNYADEHYTVYISTTGNSVADFTTVLTTGTATGTYQQISVNLSSYTGQTVYIAFRHHNTTDMFYLNLDDVTITPAPTTPTIDVPLAVDFGNVFLGDTSVITVNVNGYSLSSDITATTTSPFALSTDGLTFNTTTTIPQTGGTLYIQYIPSQAGEETGSIDLSSTGATAVTVTLRGSGVDCSPTLPLVQDFETVEDVITCWSVLSANSVNQMSIVSGMSTTGNACFRFNSLSSASDYTQYIITPELPVTTDTKMVSFDYAGYTSGTETFVVGYSLTTNDPSAFTWGTTNSVTGTTWHTFLKSDIPGDAKYIAIKYTSDYQYYMYVDNMVVDETPDCFMPNAVNVSGITFEQAVINWTPMGNETSWEVVVVEHGNDVSTGAIEYVSAHPYTATNLMPYTQYDVYVLAECTEGNSNWTPVTTFTTLPFCQIPTGINASHISYDQADINWTPAGDETSWNLVVVEHGDDISNGTVIPVTQRPYTVTGLTTATQYDVYVAADCISETSPWSSVYTFTTTPDCSNPSNPQVTSITGTSAVITWTAAPYGVNNYTVEYGEAQGGSTDQIFVDSATTVTLTGLNPQTDYEFTITSECNSATITPAPVSGTFTTGCLVGGDVVIGNGTESTYYFPSNSCYNYSTSEQIFTAAEMGNANTLHSVSFDCYSPASPSTRNLTIYLMHTAQSSANGWLTMTGAEQVYSGNYTFTAGWNTINFDTTFAYNGTDNLAIIIDDNTGSFSCSNYFNGHTNSNGSSAYFYSDGTNVNPMSPSNTPYTNSVRANIKFGGECDETSTCVTPVVTNLTYTVDEAIVTWVAGYQESAWNLQYKAANDTAWTDEGSVTSPYTISNLIPDVDYEIRLYSDCGSEMSTPAVMNFRTECAALIPPFTETFTGWDNNPSDCWNLYSGLASSVFAGGALTSTTSGWYFTNTNVFPVGHPKVNVYGSSCNYWLVTPAIDLTNMVDPELSFELALTDYNNEDPIESTTAQQDDKFMVVVSTDNGQTWSQSNATVWSDQGSARAYSSISNQGEDVSVSLAQYAGQTIMIAFYVESTVSGGDNDLHITNVHVGERPTCPKPQVVNLTNATSSSIEFSWIPAGDESAWEYTVAPQGTTLDFDTVQWISAYDTFAVISNLNANTVYTIYVRSNCDNGDQSEPKTLDARTACGEITIPFYEGFENYATGSTAPIYCWTRSNDYSSSNYPYVNTYAANGTKGLYFYGSTGNYNLIATPQIDNTVSLNTLSVSFNMNVSSASSAMVVGVMTDPTDLSTFVGVDTVTNSAAGAWVFEEVSLSSYTGNGSYVALKYMPGTSYTTVYVDDITIEEIPSCPKPTNLSAQSTASDTVLLSWTDDAGDLWDVIYGPTGFDPLTSTDAVAVYGLTTTTYSASGLTAGVIYDFYVRRDCGNGDVSPWSSFPVQASPYVITMGTTGSRSVTGCGFTVTDDGGLTGNYSDNCDARLTVNPETSADLVSISGTLTAESASWDYLIIYDGDGVTELYHSAQSSGTTVTFGPYVSTTGPLTIYFHSDGSNNYSGFALNVTCTPAPTCRKPMNFTVVGTTTTDAILSWTEMGTATTWNIEYGPAGFTQGNGTFVQASTNPFTVTGLTTATAYDFYIQSDCGGGDVSEWSSVATATTDCDVIATFPYTENFDASTNLPGCWNNANVTGYTEWEVSTPNEGSVVSAHSGNNSVIFFQDNEGDQADLQMPTFDLTSLTNPVLTFWYTNESWSGDIDELTVYYRTSATDTWSQLTSHTSGVSTWTFDSLALPNPSATYQIKFHATSNYGYGINIDDVTIMDANGSTPPVVTCDVPTNLAVSNITTTGATATWTAGGAETAWNLQYKAASAANWSNSINVTTPSYNFTGLTPNTQYQVRVQAACDATTTSDWTAAVSFATAEESGDPCVAPSNLTSTGTAAHSIDITWTENGTATSWTVYYRVNGASSWITETVNATTYTITGLEPETEYTIQVVANCADGEASEPSNTINVTTQPDGIEDYDASAINVFPNPTTGMVQVSSTKYQVSSVDVYDVYGKLLKTDAMIDNNTVNMSGYAAGVYFLRVSTENGVVTKRVVKR